VRAIVLLFCSACALAPPRGAGRPVFIDAPLEAMAVASQLEQMMSADGYRLLHAPEDADLLLRISRSSPVDKSLAPAGPAAYTVTVVRGKLEGKWVTSFDAACRNVPATLAECHAERLLEELRTAGELR
jgi:hypothetical protein